MPGMPSVTVRTVNLDCQAALDAVVRLALSVGGRLAEPQMRADLRVVLDPAGHPLCLFLR